MRYGVPLLGRRVAPRITSADSLLLVATHDRGIAGRELLPLLIPTKGDIAVRLAPFRLDVLVCGGIDPESRRELADLAVEVVDNVASDIKGVLRALKTRRLKPGYGFQNSAAKDRVQAPSGRAKGRKGAPASSGGGLEALDCLACRNRRCLLGLPCPLVGELSGASADASARRMLEAAADISLERERTLCRISELVYFCLEMKYRRIGVAFCADLAEPAEILVRLLRRHFIVHPVICKLGGRLLADAAPGDGRFAGASERRTAACNPLAQAEALNRLRTDFNVIVGLCMGVDALFAKASEAPATTLFVKDKSLANNPIGALYSEYYQKEVASTTARAGGDAGGEP